MLTRIVHNSPALTAFLDQLQLTLSQPQRQHMLNLADALLVCEDHKTLAALQRQFIDAPDPSNMADFLRISPWQGQDVRTALRTNQVRWALNQAERLGLPKVITINIDDSLGQKDKATRHLEPVDFFHDHSESTKTKPIFKNAFCYLECTLSIGSIVVTVDLRLYLREKTVRRINRRREASQRLPFRSKYHLAHNKHNRKLNGQRIDQIAYALRHKRYMQVHVSAADGNQTTYYVRQTTGRLEKVPFDVRVLFSRRHPREKSPAYFLSTDLTRSAHQALQGYRRRWSCEVVNFYLKTQLGLADFRVRSYEAVDKYMVVVLLAWAYVERRYEQERSAQIRSYGDIIRRHREEHAIDWLSGALELLRETGSVQQVLDRFLRLESQGA
jgi:hypothetical protein